MEIQKQSKYKILVKFTNGIEIRADLMSWILYIPSPRTYQYYSTLDSVFTELLDLRIKELAAKDPRKNLESLSEAINKAITEIRQITTSLTTIKIPEQSRLELQEPPMEVIDD